MQKVSAGHDIIRSSKCNVRGDDLQLGFGLATTLDGVTHATVHVLHGLACLMALLTQRCNLSSQSRGLFSSSLQMGCQVIAMIDMGRALVFAIL